MNSKASILLFASIILALANYGVNCTEFQDKVKAATKNMGGIKCLVDRVFDVEDIANDFIYDIDICNVAQQSAVVTKIVDYCESITRKTDSVIDANDNICRNAAYDDSSDAKKTPPALCASSIRTRMDKVNDFVEKTLKYVTKKEDSVTEACSKIAVTNLKENLPMFAELVLHCAD